MLLGLLVNGACMLGGEEAAVHFHDQMPKASGPAPTPQDLHSLPEAVSFHNVRLHIVVHLSMLCK